MLSHKGTKVSRVGLGDTRGKGHICMPDFGPQGVPARVKGKKREMTVILRAQNRKGEKQLGREM